VTAAGIGGWVAAALDLVLPTGCAGCERSGPLLCPSCAAALGCPARPARPDPCPVGLPPCRVVAAYGGPVRATLLAYKEHGRVDLAGPLGAALARAVAAAAPAGPVLLVPVPSRRAAVRARGGDHLARLARAAAARLRTAGRPAAVLPAVAVVGPVRDSAGLTAAERAANLRGALRVRHRRLAVARAAPLVIVDDLLTTGATLAAVAEALATAGRPPLAAAAVAATVRRGRGSPVRGLGTSW